ncbi:MAG TPA: nitroreductase/quinone reductase family protein [Acidimicrobiia bacterium]|jgi:deazaflavin-dependent oxidoreductase (nitroreductase family)|nr:nitroreductase/quinone reductase family protein [Acidimicrobiia bacterium]
MPDFNQQIIDDFHANGGQVGGMFEGATLLLLHHRGAKTGTERVSPLAYLPLEDGYAIFASKGGAPTNPDWFHNLVAHPDTTVEVGTETVPVRARVAGPDEREPIFNAQKERFPQFAEYEQKTTRQIPVVILERA